MRRVLSKPRGIKVRRYTAYFIDLKKYLGSFPGATLSVKICVTELREILLNSMPTSWSKQEYLKGFDGESISFQEAVNMFDQMEIAEYIYEVVLEPSYKNY